MRTLLLNDTRSDEHVGCTLVIENILRCCSIHGLRVIGRVPNAASEYAEKVASFKPGVLLVNGEGTLHTDRPKAIEIGKAAMKAKELGATVVLINALWHNNRALNDYLHYFDKIYCRDGESASAITRLGHKASVVPDMIFSTDLESPEVATEPETVLVYDSVIPRTARRMYLYAWKRGYTFKLLRNPEWRMPIHWRIRKLLSHGRHGGCLLSRPDPDASIRDIASHGTVIAPRFHAACLSLLYGKPCIGIASNTPKIQTLYAEAGITDWLYKEEQVIPRYLDGLIQSGPEAREEFSLRASAYVREARSKIENMFADISHTAMRNLGRPALG